MDISNRYRVRRVDVVIYPGFKAIEAVGAVNAFEYANVRLAQEGLPPAYELHICAPEPGIVKSDSLIVLEADLGLDLQSVPDTALIIGTRDIDGALASHPQLVNWCRQAIGSLTRLVGVCSGAFFLAAAGLLNGCKATTHWSVSRQLASQYPEIEVTEDAIFVHEGKIWTSAGVTAVLDLVLALIEEDLGRGMALSVARDLVIYLKRPGGQSQFSQLLSSQMTTHSGVRRLQEWILQSLDQNLSIKALSARAAMSPRNLSRVFLRETGHPPAEFIELARIELAKRFLEEGQSPLKAVARRCGFHSDDHLRRVFQRRCGITPGAYQERFRR